MKKILLFILPFYAMSFCALNAQVLNQSANWPNNQWSLDGSYDNTYLYEDPTQIAGSTSFSFDDDDAGSSSVNDVAVQSPVIDLTAAYNANEINITVSFQYVLNIYQNEALRLQYWDVDASQWVNWGDALSDNSTANTNFCSSVFSLYTSSLLDISSFSSSQLQNFRYRIYYDDNGSYGWGFCANSPTVSSSAVLACPDVVNLSTSNVNANSADACWSPGSSETQWEVALRLTTDPIPASGTPISTNSNRFTGLNPGTNYVVYVRANCGIDGYSNWVLMTFSTGSNISGHPVTFTNNTINTTGGWDIALVDLNGDFLDDVVSVSSNNINVHYQKTTGGFETVNIGTTNADNSPTWSLAAGDFDGNGFNDLLYGGGSGVTFMKANSTGTAYTEISGLDYVFSQRSNFIDINNDGHLDAFVCHDVDPNVFYINDGSGNLTFYQGETPGVVPNGLGLTPGGGNYGTVWIDFDNDRDMDMFIAKCRGGSTTISTNELWRNDGGGNFVNVADSNNWYDFNYPSAGHNNSSNLGDNVQTWSSAWADFDNDGDMDVFVGASNTTNGNSKLMRNNGDGTFTDVTSGSGVIGAALGIENAPADFDNDGYVDILSNGDILFNDGTGNLTFTNFPSSVPPNGAIGDTNNDGFLDVFRNGVIYVNNTNSNNWIKINTIGTVSNLNGIGARVEVHTTSGIQIRDVRSGEGFEFMSSLNTHFGIGTDTTIIKVVVYWPSGIIDTVFGPTINTTLSITENATLTIEDETLSDVIIYPNPVVEVLTIQTSQDITDRIATVFDINGKRVLNTKLEDNSLNVSKLQTGIYFLRLESNGKSITRKFIKE
ncbi:MAG: FG-GAP-like repeat-containing protein [Bacteroidota bacterium]